MYAVSRRWWTHKSRSVNRAQNMSNKHKYRHVRCAGGAAALHKGRLRGILCVPSPGWSAAMQARTDRACCLVILSSNLGCKTFMQQSFGRCNVEEQIPRVRGEQHGVHNYRGQYLCMRLMQRRTKRRVHESGIRDE